MIEITENLHLQSIKVTDATALFTLMKEIYPLAYSHFWTDNGAWYVNSQYAKEQVVTEVLQEKSENYFILFNKEIIGNFRIVWDEKLAGISKEKQVKLHRIYLHPKTQGNGLGKKLLSWLDEKAIKKGYTMVWLDAMDAQPQAFQFYKKLGYNYYSHTFLPFNYLHDEVRKMSQVYKKLK